MNFHDKIYSATVKTNVDNVKTYTELHDDILSTLETTIHGILIEELLISSGSKKSALVSIMRDSNNESSYTMVSSYEVRNSPDDTTLFYCTEKMSDETYIYSF